MKSVLFGNPNTDCWKLSLDDVSAREQIVALKGELRAGFFQVSTPLCIPPAVLSRFATDVRQLDQTLTGSATLEHRSRASAVRFTLTVDHVGHVHVTGRYEINNNSLDFAFRSDQTQLAPLARWLESVVTEYETNAA